MTDEERLEINLSRGILVDPQDEWLLRLRLWTISYGYPTIHMRGEGEHRNHRLHHFIIGYPLLGIVDHINRNKLDNRRENLRYASVRQNALNSFVGDNPHHNIRLLPSGNYQVQMYVDKVYYNQVCPTMDAAIRLRNAWMKEWP